MGTLTWSYSALCKRTGKNHLSFKSWKCWVLNAVRELRRVWQSCSLGPLVPGRLHNQPQVQNCSSPIPSADPNSSWLLTLFELNFSSPVPCRAGSELGSSCVAPQIILLCVKHGQLVHHEHGNFQTVQGQIGISDVIPGLPSSLQGSQSTQIEKIVFIPMWK